MSAQYSWSITSAVWQLNLGLDGPRTQDAYSFLDDKIQNGDDSQVREIAMHLLFSTGKGN